MNSKEKNTKPSLPTNRLAITGLANARPASISSVLATKAIFVSACLGMMITLSGCSTSTLPWPDLSVSSDEADEALSKKEQTLLDELLTNTQKTHDKDAVREIEGR